jgi:uncharacterized C2H2 Zn-finger protein
VIICEIIVHLLVIVQNNKRCTVHGVKIITLKVHTVYDAGGRSVLLCSLCERLLIVRNRWVRHVARVWGEVKYMQCFVGETLGKRLLE